MQTDVLKETLRDMQMDTFDSLPVYGLTAHSSFQCNSDKSEAEWSNQSLALEKVFLLLHFYIS